MSDMPTIATSEAQNHAQSVSIVLPNASMWLLGTLIISLVLCVAIASRAMERADDAYEASSRAQRQADLANWTMMNLEGLLRERGVDVPRSLAPHNLTSKPKE